MNDQNQDDDPRHHEEIDLNEEEESALDEVWKRIEKEGWRSPPSRFEEEA